MIVSILYNINRGKSQAKSPADFMPDFAKAEPAPDESMRSLFRIAAEGLPRKEDKWQEAHS